MLGVTMATTVADGMGHFTLDALPAGEVLERLLLEFEDLFLQGLYGLLHRVITPIGQLLHIRQLRFKFGNRLFKVQKDHAMILEGQK